MLSVLNVSRRPGSFPIPHASSSAASWVRFLSSTPPRPSPSSSPSPIPRVYRYYQDVHGQLFLYDTVPKNLTSCFKDARFLNFFYDRVKLNRPDESSDSDVPQPKRTPSSGKKEASKSPPPPSSSPTPPRDWHEDVSFLSRFTSVDSLQSFAREQGYHWLSPCQGEHNYLSIARYGTPIVFKELIKGKGEGKGKGEDGDEGEGEDRLKWAGDRECPLRVDQLKVCPESGYLYHPSPHPQTTSWHRRLEQASNASLPPPSPYGPYSLLASSLILQHFSAELDLDTGGFAESEKAGTVVWRGKKREVGVLRKEDRWGSEI